MSENVGPSPPPPPTPHQVWARTTFWTAVVAIVVGAGVFVIKSCRDVPRDVLDKTASVIDRTSQALSTVASAFHRGTITTSFIGYATTLTNTRHFQFAALRQTEVFTRKDEASTGFGYIPLPDVVVEARAPVEFVYYLDLNAPWRFVVKDNVLHVFAPRIRFNKPAVDASEIQYEVRKGSMLRDTITAQDNLKKSITALSEQRARDNIALVRETGRRQTAEFVEQWLARSFSDGQRYPVKVYFADETPPSGVVESPPK
jgi:hypothetical protein